MKGTFIRNVLIALVMASMTTLLVQNYAEARAGGGSRSMGSRGSRSYSQPASPSMQPSPYQAQQPRPVSPSPFQQPQPAGGGFLRSMAGGMVGGMLGGMLFRSLGFGGMGGMGGGMGGGPGIFDIILIGGIIYLIYRMIKKRREEASAYPSAYEAPQYQQPVYSQTESQPAYAAGTDPLAGITHIRQMDGSFDEERFGDQAMDLFFKIQGAWMHRDLSPVLTILTDEMRRIFQGDLDDMKRQGRINRLENIAVRTVEIVEAWQEQGQDFVTARIYANLLDYTTDESGKVLEGSTAEPVKFEEFWTFTRPVGPNQWKLSAINQK